MEIDAMSLNSTTQYHAMGYYGDNNCYALFGSSATYTITAAVTTNGTRIFSETSWQNERHVVKLDKGSLYIDNTFLGSLSLIISTPKNIWIGALNAETALAKHPGRIYSSKIWDNDILVRNMVPAQRTSDSEIGMYDTVSKTFFTNAGTGTFTAGPEVGTVYNINLPAPLQKIETYKDSIESDGTLTGAIGKTTLSAGTSTISDAMSNSPFLCTQQTAGTLSGQSITLDNGVTDADVYYVKATATETTIQVPVLSTNKGTNIISAETNIKPSNMEFTYRKRTKE